jgi:hypothetical protein
VSAKTRPDLAKCFPFTKHAEARTYLETLRSEHPKAVLTQGENKLLVRSAWEFSVPPCERTRAHCFEACQSFLEPPNVRMMGCAILCCEVRWSRFSANNTAVGS